MYKFAFLFLVLFFLLIADNSNPQNKGVEVVNYESNFGKNYLVLIAINKYKHWPRLNSPIKDAEDLKTVLESHYIFNKIEPIYDEDATKIGIIEFFEKLQRSVNKNDSVLIYFAGHGYFVESSGNSYWIPTDGGYDFRVQDRWINFSEIRGLIGNLKANHVLLISDSCFSGELLEAKGSMTQNLDDTNLIKRYNYYRYRKVLTSGSKEKVPDNSEFIQHIISALKENTSAILEANTIWDKILRDVNKTKPRFGELPRTGHMEDAVFLFFKKFDEFEKDISLPRNYKYENLTKKALEFYKETFPIWQAMGDWESQVAILKYIGRLYFILGQKQKALEYYLQALKINRDFGGSVGEVTILNNIGIIYNDIGQKQKAIDYFQQALLIHKKNGDMAGEASTLNNIGQVYFSIGQKKKSLDYYGKALSIFSEVGDRPGESSTLNYIGMVYSDIGQKQKAFEYYEKALLIFRELGDISGEGLTLSNIGKVYADFYQMQKALEYYGQALPILREVGNRSGEGATLDNIGWVYDTFGQKQKALEYFEKALPIRREVGDRSGEATTLNNIGGVYSDLGQKQKAMEYYRQALPICTSVGDRSGEANTLNNIGVVYSHLGQKQKALEYFEKALPIVREVGNRFGEAIILNHIGNVYSHLGLKQKALEYFEKALPIVREVGSRFDEANSLNSIGMLYSDLGQKQKALKYYQAAIIIRHEMRDRSGEATTLNNIGMLYSDLGQKQKMLEYFEKALTIFREIGNRSGEANTMNNIGKLFFDFGQKQKSLEYLEKALLIHREVGNRSGEATTLSNIEKVYSDLGQKRNALAIFYGKQAVNTLQYLRQNIDTLDIKTKIKYLQSIKSRYRNTASQLIFSGRLGEAQQILDIFKDEEYFSYVRLDRSAYTPQYNPIDFTGFEQKWIEWQSTLMEKMFSIRRPYHELLFKPNKTPEEEKKQEALKCDLEKAQMEYSDFLHKMEKEFEIYKYKEDPDIAAITKQSAALKEYLRSLDRDNNGKNAALHFLVYKGQISVIITTPTSQTFIQSPPFGDKEFNKMIYNYREGIEKLAHLSSNPTSSSTAASKIDELSREKQGIENKLYGLIFKPVHQYLKQYGAVNLLVSLDGVLRYIPLTLLWDGDHYLVQQYRFVLLTPSSLKHIKEKPVIENKILGMGASKGGKGFKPLLHVGQEIRAIVNDREKGCTGLMKGNALIDNDFTRETMLNRLKTTSYPFVHIASHFKFSPGGETDNQLLLGDGTTISLSDIRKVGKLFAGVELLVLSASQTGMGGNGEEIDGFGELAQQCGAGSVIASLWAVDDESTKELMVKFYSLLKEGKVTSKIEALRLAQLELAGLDDLINKSKGTAPGASARRKDYSNPYYWAPFIMMGDWR